MTKKQLKTLQELLIERQQEILARVGASTDDISSLQGENAADWVDRVSLDDAMNNLLSKESDLARELERIFETLQKIEKTGYGICEECKNEVAFERLEAVPTARFCIDCKNLIERRQKRGSNNKGSSSIPSEVFEWFD